MGASWRWLWLRYCAAGRQIVRKGAMLKSSEVTETCRKSAGELRTALLGQHAARDSYLSTSIDSGDGLKQRARAMQRIDKIP